MNAAAPASPLAEKLWGSSSFGSKKISHHAGGRSWPGLLWRNHQRHHLPSPITTQSRHTRRHKTYCPASVQIRPCCSPHCLTSTAFPAPVPFPNRFCRERGAPDQQHHWPRRAPTVPSSQTWASQLLPAPAGVPGLPNLFVEAGWLTPVLCVIGVWIMTTLSSAMFCEAMRHLPNNSDFEVRFPQFATPHLAPGATRGAAPASRAPNTRRSSTTSSAGAGTLRRRSGSTARCSR